ncbi:hypothetical protein ABOZ73_07645 [Caulobacter sp. 73W]|uniref:Uncharacterized protein n=1 Tax=Caulobacter sp. 73W TaxID=3161137 RepID=A0AB39KXA7_9CAUL
MDDQTWRATFQARIHALELLFIQVAAAAELKNPGLVTQLGPMAEGSFTALEPQIPDHIARVRAQITELQTMVQAELSHRPLPPTLPSSGIN